MPDAQLLHNLNLDTYRSDDEDFLSPKGFLLAPNNATKTLKNLRSSLRDRDRELLVDNGNFVLIGRIRKQFSAQSKALFRQTKEIENALGRSVRPGDLPLPLRNAYKNLANDIRTVCLDSVPDNDHMLAEQFALDPTRLIGTEDLTQASWLSLDIERAYTQFPRAKFRSMNEKVAKIAHHTLGDLPHRLGFYYFPVASAVSYNTAYDAGAVFAKRKIRSASMGFGAYMADSNFVDHMFVGRSRLDFGSNLPARYMRTVGVAIGFWKGYQSVLGKPPLRFHFLGLGAPIMLPLIALACRRTKELTFDATSPIKDGTQGGTLYVEKPVPLKIRTRKVVFRLAATPKRRWDCPCPFCQDFESRHPFKYKKGRSWFIQNQPEKIVATDLKPGGGLYDAYPLFSEPQSGDPLRKEVNFARVGHNHWVIEQILASVRARKTKRELKAYVEHIVNEYAKFTSPPFEKAVRTAYELIE